MSAQTSLAAQPVPPVLPNIPIRPPTTTPPPVPARRRTKSRLADTLPSGPGVYQFRSAADQVLYVGSAVDLKRRVRSYFTAAEKRRKVAQMLDTTVSVRHIATPTLIEARVRELRMIAELDTRPVAPPAPGPRAGPGFT